MTDRRDTTMLPMMIGDHPPAPVGHFLLTVYRHGRLVETMDRPNLIVTGSRHAHATLLGGATSGVITDIGFGSSLTPAAYGNTTLTAPYTKAVDGVSYPASNAVAFAFSLGTGEDNGAAIGEFGLLTANGALYARIVRSTALIKTSDLSFTSTWTITFP
jgi:hypothetical protein